MSNNNNSLSDVILDQTLFILENYVEIMSIVHNTQAQINRQQQTMVRKMNTLISELRRQQAIDAASESVRSSFGTFQQTNNNASTNDERERLSRERFRSRFEQQTRNISRELFRPPLRSQNSRNRDLFRRPLNSSRSPTRRSRNTSSTTTQPTQSLFNFGNTSNTSTNTSTNTNTNTNTNTTNGTNSTTGSTSGILLNFDTVFPFGETSNTGTRNPFQASFGINPFENVPVFPSPEQIENATTTMHFQDISNPMNTTCPITMETFSPNQIVVKINHCGHVFNQTHLHSWFRTHVRCPVCRYDIRDDVSGNISSGEENTNTQINFSPLPSISEDRDGERNQSSPPAAGGGSDSEQQLDDDLNSVSRMLLQALMTPSTTQNNTQLTTSLQPSITTSIRSTTVPLSWTHMMPSVPLSPLTINQRSTITPSTGSRNNQTSPSPDTSEGNNETQNTQEDEALSQVD